MTRPTVLIVGAGFSGSLLAVHLLAAPDGPRVVLAERAETFARGCAYSTHHALHRLNVRAGNMSAFPGDPGHFSRWLAEIGRGDASADAFVERGVYGAYLQSILKAAAGAPVEAGRLMLTQDEVVDARADRHGVTVAFAMGREQRADHLVLATGPGPASPPPGVDPDRLPPGVFQNDPWDERAFADAEGAEVLLLGTGLTMADAAFALTEGSRTGRITALSRRGLTPRAHVPGQPRPPAPASDLPASALGLLRHVRRLSKDAGWRGAVDSLRPATTRLWRSAPDPEKARFVRHLRPWWDAHRHRMSPEAAGRLQALVREGRLRIVAGRLLGAEPAEGGAEVRWRARGSATEETATVGRIVNCTGPGGAAALATAGLTARLLASGHVRPDPLGWGLDVTDDGRLIRKDGTPQSRLHALGPLTRGAFLESTAVPDIRNMAEALALSLLARERAAGPSALTA